MTRAVGSFWRKAYEENVTGMAAMVAYNLLLSLFPIALIALYIAGHVLSSPEVQAPVVTDLQQVFPSATEETLLDVLRRVRESSTTVGIAAIAASLWIGSYVFARAEAVQAQLEERPLPHVAHRLVAERAQGVVDGLPLGIEHRLLERDVHARAGHRSSLPRPPRGRRAPAGCGGWGTGSRSAPP